MPSKQSVAVLPNAVTLWGTARLLDFYFFLRSTPPMPEFMPALFVGHGSPMNAIEDNAFSRAWAAMGKSLPRPQAILSISAHWQTAGSRLTAMPAPATIHDFYGFPQLLYEKQYPAAGAPDLAGSIRRAIADPTLELDFDWGLDHGTWSVLGRMFPRADVPVLQLSLDSGEPPLYHYRLGQKLKYLRGQGILIIGSGNMVHNLGVMAWQHSAFDWARDFDARLASLIRDGDHRSLTDYHTLGDGARLAIPTNEHYLPLLYVLAMQDKTDLLSFFCEQVTLGSISMRSLKLDRR
jgi:4,5-DOPA dioxygenase extradiol